MTTLTAPAISAIKRASILGVAIEARGTLAKPIHVRYKSVHLPEGTTEVFYTLGELLRWVVADATFMSDDEKSHLLEWFETSVKTALKKPVGAGYFSKTMPIRGNWNNGSRTWEISNDTFDILCDYAFGRCNSRADWVKYDFDGLAYACEHHMSQTQGFEWEPVD